MGRELVSRTSLAAAQSWQLTSRLPVETSYDSTSSTGAGGGESSTTGMSRPADESQR